MNPMAPSTPVPPSLDTPAPAAPEQPPERFTIKAWLEQDRSIKRGEICLAAMMKGWDPQDGAETIELSKDELDAALHEARHKFTEIRGPHAINKTHLIADNTLLVCIVAKQPTGAVIDRFMAGLLDEGGQAKAQAQKQLFLDCVMWPAPADRTALLERFPTLPYSFGGQIFNRASGVKEEQEKKR